MADRLDALLDRNMLAVDGLKDAAARTGQRIILSAVPLDSLKLVAQSAAHSPSQMKEIADWFNRNVARRNAGDHLDPPSTYFLYAPAQ